MIGQRFGLLTVTQKIVGRRGANRSTLWECLCDCGNTIEVRTDILRSGHTCSCGCYRKNKRIDIRGKRFGQLVVVDVASQRDGSRGLFWTCRCDCGTFCTVSSRSLRAGNTTSCGCLVEDKSIEAMERAAYYEYCRSAKRRSIACEITYEEFLVLTKQNCYYCLSVPQNTIEDKRTRKDGKRYNTNIFIYNGLDRVDSTKGYTLDNVVPCCKYCNMMKSNTEIEEFINRVNLIAKNHPRT